MSPLDSLIACSDTFPNFRNDIVKKASIRIRQIAASIRFAIKTETYGEGGRGHETIHVGVSQQVEEDGEIYLAWTRKEDTPSAPFQFHDTTDFVLYMRENRTDQEPGCLYRSTRSVNPAVTWTAGPLGPDYTYIRSKDPRISRINATLEFRSGEFWAKRMLPRRITVEISVRQGLEAAELCSVRIPRSKLWNERCTASIVFDMLI